MLEDNFDGCACLLNSRKTHLKFHLEMVLKLISVLRHTSISEEQPARVEKKEAARKYYGNL